MSKKPIRETAVVKDFLPKNRVAALTLLQQVKNAILRGGKQNSLKIKQFNANNDTSKDGWFHKLSQVEQKKALALNNVTVVLSAYTANFLLEAIHYIELGESADKALGITEKIDVPAKNRQRNLLIALDVKSLQVTTNCNLDEAESNEDLLKKYKFKSSDSLHSARGNALADLEFYEEINKWKGKEFANTWVESLEIK